MRKLIVANLISLDGFYSGLGENVMALPFHEGFSEYNAERLRASGTVLLGRTSYEGFKSYWPHVADDTEATPVDREISHLMGAIDKVVISDTLTPDQTAPWHNTDIVPRKGAHEHVAKLKGTQGKDILVFGSRVMWNDLLTAGLVDELHLMIGPGLVGSGTTVFEGGSPVPLDLLETRTLGTGQLILTRYTPRT